MHVKILQKKNIKSKLPKCLIMFLSQEIYRDSRELDRQTPVTLHHHIYHLRTAGSSISETMQIRLLR